MRLGDLIWRVAAMVLLACVAGEPACAREVPLQTCVARLDPGRDATLVAADPARLDCAVRQNSLGGGNFVTQLRFSPVVPEPGNPLILRTSSLWQQAGHIRFRYADGRERRLDFTSANVSRYLTLGAIMEFPVPARTSPLTSILFETSGSANLRGVMLGVSLVTQDEAFSSRLAYTAVYAGFAGLAIALCIYNLALWQALRNRFQLYYCLMVAALGAYAFTSSGALMLVAPWLDNNDRIRINYVVLAISALTGVRFIRNFFEREVDDLWLARAFRIASVAAIASALAFALLAPWRIAMLDRLYFVAMSSLLLLVFPFLALAWRRRVRYFPLFMAAWSAPLLISALRAAHGFNLVPYSFWLDNGNLTAMAIEALLSSLLVTARVRQISEERDHALRGERSARRLAGTDSLTGMLNRRAFLDLAIGRREQQRLMLIDIDHFKRVNDRYGHELGDRVLVAIADIIQACRPDRSLAVRLGGEEFALLMPRKVADQCCADTILDAVREKAMPQGLKVTISIGISEGLVTSQEEWKRLYRLADAALYRAKADGRDRFCRATDFRAAA